MQYTDLLRYLILIFSVTILTVALQTTLEILEYDVTLDLRQMFSQEMEKCRGSVKIRTSFSSEATSIRLYAWRMDFHDVSVNCNGEFKNVTEVLHRKFVDDNVLIEVWPPFNSSEICTIQIAYSLMLKDLYGLYKSYFPSKYDFDSNFVSITTNNEPNMARLWTPCFDDLSFLSNWTVTLLHPIRSRVFAYTPVRKSIKGDYRKSTLVSPRNMQSSQLNFAILEDFRFRSDAVKTFTNQTIRFWFPRGTVFKTKIKDLLADTADFFTDMTKLFNYTIDCRIIEIVALQHQMGVSSGCLIIIDHRSNFTTTQLRSQIVKLWMGSTVLYSNLNDAWFHHSLCYYLAKKWRNNQTFVQTLNETVHNPFILERPLVVQYSDTWDSVFMYPNKGVMVMKMIEDALGEVIFSNMLKEILVQYSFRFFGENDLFYLMRRSSKVWNRPSCFRAFLGTQSEFTGLPVIHVFTNTSTITINQTNYAITDETDPRYRPWTFISKWTIPIHIYDNETRDIKWLNHDESQLVIHNISEKVFIDPNGDALYLVQFEDQGYLMQLWSRTQNCSKFRRYCLDYMTNEDFCQNVYAKKCARPEVLSEQILYSGTRHNWDD